MPVRSAPAVTAVREAQAHSTATVSDNDLPAALPADVLDDRINDCRHRRLGKTYAAKGFVEPLLETGAQITIVDPLGVWWGLRASANRSAPGYRLSFSADAVPTCRSRLKAAPRSDG